MSGVGKVQTVGQISPARPVYPARSISSLLILKNPAHVLPPNVQKGERLFSRWVGFSRTLIVDDADRIY